MGVLDSCRVLFYLVEWIWTAVIVGVFPNQLTEREALIDDGKVANICYFNQNIGLSRCNFGLAWGAIAFIVLTCTIFWYSLEYCTSVLLPSNVELVVFAWLTLWWFVGAVVLTATKASGAPTAATITVVFAWMLMIMSALSSLISSRASKSAGSYGVGSDRGDEVTASVY